MNDRDLIKALEKRFSKLGHLYPEEDILAEVLRQMKWARSQGSCAPYASPTLIEVSIAPDDWNVPE